MDGVVLASWSGKVSLGLIEGSGKVHLLFLVGKPLRSQSRPFQGVTLIISIMLPHWHFQLT